MIVGYSSLSALFFLPSIKVCLLIVTFVTLKFCTAVIIYTLGDMQHDDILSLTNLMIYKLSILMTCLLSSLVYHGLINKSHGYAGSKCP